MIPTTLSPLPNASPALPTENSRQPQASPLEWLQRADTAQRLRDAGATRQEAARHIGVPEPTLAEHLRKRQHPSDPIAQFFDSVDGRIFLERLVAAAHLVFVEKRECGIASIGEFLAFTQLDAFVAPSYGVHQAYAAEMETALAEYGQHQRESLAAKMPSKQITLAEDETFHCGKICLVAIEPVSNYLVTECYCDNRNTDTWQSQVEVGIAGMSVDVIQVTSDEAAALIKHAEQTLAANHSPDLFHVQHDVVKAGSLPLAGRLKKAQSAVDEVQKRLEEKQQVLKACREQCPDSPETLAELSREVQVEAASLERAKAEVDTCQTRRESYVEQMRNIGRVYHPWDLDTGQERSVEVIGQELNTCFDELETIATEASLSDNSQALIAKARRVLPQMISTIVWLWQQVAALIESWNLSPEEEAIFRRFLIPACYLERVAKRLNGAAVRRTLRANAAWLRDQAWSSACFVDLGPEQRAMWLDRGFACADLFQRSSSCVEGRNGYLSLFHHAMHGLSPQKLESMRVLHNFYSVPGTDRPTPAERFFGSKPDDLFEWLLKRLPPLPRPRPRNQAGS